jgi:hypothetical protein
MVNYVHGFSIFHYISLELSVTEFGGITGRPWSFEIVLFAVVSGQRVYLGTRIKFRKRPN